MKKSYGALVVGAGIGGIRAALDLAETGQKVALIDKRNHTGGLLTQLDHQFPSDHCGMCKMLPLTQRDTSSQFCMRKGLFHHNIDIMLSTDLVRLDGDPGSFHVTLSRKSTFVDPHKCIGCGKCSEVCPVRVPDEFNAGLSERTAVHLPVPHQIPNHYMIDLDNCIRCWKCHEACPTGAIDIKFDERPDFHVLVAVKDSERADELKDWLNELNFKLHFAATGQETIDKAEAIGTPGMLILDTDLEDPGPERVLTRLLEINPEIAAVLVSRPGKHEAVARKLAEQGARDVLTWPLKRRNLVPMLDKMYMRTVSDETMEIETASVVLATGFDCYNPSDDPEGVADALMYGSHPGVVTSLEFERMLSSSGPDRIGNLQSTKDKLVRRDGTPVRRIAWLQCVGSRDVKLNADYCSSICCMFSIKEALLAKKTAARAGHELDAAIFYMDMRTFGKNFQRYRESAENDSGVRFIRSRIHSVLPEPEGPGLRIEWSDDQGKRQEEIFDMLVLACGGKPSSGTRELARVTDVELNDYGFIKTKSILPARTSRYGVMAAGSASGPKDIAESVTHSGAAALEASRLINIYAPLMELTPDPEPEYRDVSREKPRITVALCASCPVLGQGVDLDDLTARLEKLPNVVQVQQIAQGCTAPGWEQIEKLVEETSPNRVLIGACRPYSYIPKLRELGRTVGLNPALMDVVDIYTPAAMETKAGNNGDAASPEAENGEAERRISDVFTSLRMAAAKLGDSDPAPPKPPQPVVREALVVGGGLAGMTAALGIADHGYPVHLVEERETLGGLAMQLRTTLEGDDPVRYMEDLVAQVEKHPNITVYTDARVSLSTGGAGRFMSLVATDEGAMPVSHGVTVLATGGREARVYEYGFRVHKAVCTQLELEQRLASGELDTGALNAVAMIQCWRSREEGRNYCSRVCCSSAIKNLLTLKERHPDLPIYVFYRDIMTYGFMEEYYTKARKAGAIFIRYEPSNKPEVTFEDEKPVIRVVDPVLQRPVEIRADLLALSTGIEPNEEAGEMAELFGVELNEDGFFQEAESKWRPVDFLKQGVFMAGLAHAPGTMRETIASAKAAAQRSLRILNEKRPLADNVVAEVRHSLCSRCGRCITVCPYTARRMDLETDTIIVDELLCQGCGSCAAVCPNSATVLRGFQDGRIMAMIDAAVGFPAETAG